ncbi:alpha/beta fold hydrolase [Naasia lichenicola]|uniref:Alpha/beta hydrolase n=1 Tax=Naasia lichenicola TaxID=2565933 RepID=A0A4S4FQL9_9MICO|nr:alpha/beta hydrolase [Naasia lichenicola]THG32893.1 alpha/beta hydrolase [Naasia lichenicola]
MNTRLTPDAWPMPRSSSPTRMRSVRDSGGTGPVIVLLHGFLASSGYWNRLEPHLVASGYRVIAVDLLGFGLAPKPQRSRYGYPEHVAYIDSVVARLGLRQPFLLVGHSMGALIAARYALEHEQRVEALVLLNPPLYRDAQEARAVLRRTGRVYRFLLDSRFRQFGWSLLPTITFFRISRHSLRSRELSLRNVIERSGIDDDLARLGTRTLLLVGLRDRPEYGVNLRSWARNSQVTVLTADVSHHSPVMRPRQVADAVDAFARGA